MYNEDKITNSLKQQLQKKRNGIKLCVGICVYPLSSLVMSLRDVFQQCCRKWIKMEVIRLFDSNRTNRLIQHA